MIFFSTLNVCSQKSNGCKRCKALKFNRNPLSIGTTISQKTIQFYGIGLWPAFIWCGMTPIFYQSVTKIQTREQKGKCMYTKKDIFYYKPYVILYFSFHHLLWYIYVIQIFLYFHIWLKHHFFMCNITYHCHNAKLKLTYDTSGTLTALGNKIMVFYNGTLCSLVDRYQYFSGTCLHFLLLFRLLP